MDSLQFFWFELVVPAKPKRVKPNLGALLTEIRDCEVCKRDLPSGPHPILAAHQDASIVIIGQAPGSRVHESGVPWDDASGEILIGDYAQRYYLAQERKATLTKTVQAWKEYRPAIVPLPHPSPRNNIWLSKNPWFGDEILPYLRSRVKQCL